MAKKHATNGAKAAPVSLEDLASQINQAREKAVEGVRTSLQHARETGDLLLKAKKLVKQTKGQWLPWLETNCTLSEAEAQRYMRIAKHYDELVKKCENLADLTMRAALQLLSGKPGRAAKGEKAEVRRLPVPAGELRSVTREACHMKFADGSKASEFVRGLKEETARKVLAFVARATKEDGEERTDPARLAVAVLEHLKETLGIDLVVVEADKGSPEGAASEGDVSAADLTTGQAKKGNPHLNGDRNGHRNGAAVLS